MEHQYIEFKKQKLYSVYHEPKFSINNNKKGVILCYPIGQEYIRCHKLFVNMAQKFSNIGIHVIRFDYYGQGDSDGNFENATINNWIENINIVKNEFEQACDINEIILIGIRFGANLALQYANKYKNIHRIVLWKPIYNGKDYINSMRKENERWLLSSFAKMKQINENGIECLGFFFSKRLIEEIKRESIIREQLLIKSSILLLDDLDELNARNIPNVTFKDIVKNSFWTKHKNEFDKSMVPIHEVNFIKDWL